MVFGTKDSLLDAGWKFMEILSKHKKDVKMLVYNHMPHGFLSYDMKESKPTIADASKILKELLI